MAPFGTRPWSAEHPTTDEPGLESEGKAEHHASEEQIEHQPEPAPADGDDFDVEGIEQPENEPAPSSSGYAVTQQSPAAGEQAPPSGGAPTAADEEFLSRAEIDEYNSRWEMALASFVDDPRHAVQEADGLVWGIAQRLTQVMAERREELVQAWGTTGHVDTEELRLALQRYRGFLQNLMKS